MTSKKADDTLHSYRCTCGKLLFKGLLLDSTIQIKCKKCGKLMSFQGVADATLPESPYALMLDSHGGIVSASSNIQKLFGYTLPELLSKNYGDLLATVPGKTVRADFSRLWSLPRKERYFFKSKVTHLKKDGKIIPGIAQSKFIKTAASTVLFNVFHPGTKKAARMETEPEFLSLHEYPFFLQVSCDGICLDASAARKRPYSRPRDEIVGKPFASFMHESADERERLLRQLNTGEPFELTDKNFSRVDGTSVRMDAFFTPNFDKNGACTDYMVYVFHRDLLANHERQFASRQSL